MKILNFTPTVLVLGGFFSLTSCITTTPVHYPPDDRRVIYTDPGTLPPGQAKKIYGDRSGRAYAPGQQRRYGQGNRTVYYPLIVLHTPDIVIRRAGDGRYYYRNRDGFYYWQGSDNCYYLDDRYLGTVRYDQNEYRDWERRRKGKYRDDDDDDDKRRGSRHRGRH